MHILIYGSRISKFNLLATELMKLFIEEQFKCFMENINAFLEDFQRGN